MDILRKDLCKLAGVTLDKKGHVHTSRRLPEEIPYALVPPYVKKLHMLYKSDAIPRSRDLYHTRSVLRRYHLIPAPTRICYKELPPNERHQRRLAYVKEWRKRKKAERQPET